MSERGVCICPECGLQFSDRQKRDHEAMIQTARDKLGAVDMAAVLATDDATKLRLVLNLTREAYDALTPSHGGAHAPTPASGSSAVRVGGDGR